MKKSNKKGFTIVELVIVIAVIAILAAVLIPTFTGVSRRAKESAALQGARDAYTKVAAFDGFNDDDDTDIGENYLIKSGDYYFEVKDGKLVEPEEYTKSKPAGYDTDIVESTIEDLADGIELWK
ncbi:MAG: type II secretion system protein [Clostridia bacterium]|nr:type II secretion system protein [Clostridia bacterium]